MTTPKLTDDAGHPVCCEAMRRAFCSGTDNEGLADSLSMDGVWTSEGAFTIEWHDEDRVKVTKHWREFDDVAILTGGDFETILETLFTQAEVTRTHHDSEANA